MDLVADEGVDRPIVNRLRQDGHDVPYITELQPGMDDEDVLAQATSAHMTGFLQSRIAASVILATGAVLLLIGVVGAGQLGSVDRHGVFEIGHVAAASDSRVTLTTYERHGEDHTVTAYPKSSSDFAEGDVVQIRVVLDGGRVAVIEGTENSTDWYLI